MRYLVLLAVAVFVSGCSSTAHLNSVQSGSIVRVKNTSLDKAVSVQSGTGTDVGTLASSVKVRDFSIPRKESFPTSTFGKYEFKAEHPGFEPLYGVLPRKFNPGYLALDILFFTPAMFFNLSGVYPYYEFDLEKRVVRYRGSEKEPWQTYVPTLEQMNLARAYFKEEPLLPTAAKETNAPAAQNGSSQNDVKAKLSKLDELYESKLITKEEYEVKRAKIIDGI